MAALIIVVPAQAGIQLATPVVPHWIPAYAGMANSEGQAA